jgi:hypothetical protein
MNARLYLLISLVFPAFSFCAPQQRTTPSGGKIAAVSLRETSAVSELASMMGRLAVRVSTKRTHLGIE